MQWQNKFIPSNYYEDVSLIDYEALKEQGVKTLFFDLDNTILPYDIDVLPPNMTSFVEDLTKDFKVVIVSNSHFKRVSTAVKHLKDIPFVHFSKKPLKFGLKKALKVSNSKPDSTAMIGDQIMTDIFGANRMKFKKQILIYPVKKKSDHFSTKINRFFERMVLKRIKKKNINEYNKVLRAYVEHE